MSFMSFENFYLDLEKSGMRKWVLPFQKAIEKHLRKPDGNRTRWSIPYQALPNIKASIINLDSRIIQIGSESDIDSKRSKLLKELLKRFHPWRKGPYKFFDIFIDSEWKSDMKWERLKNHISSLKNKKVIDVGCGNGYHMWKMLAKGASFVVGADPSSLFLAQFQVIKKYIGNAPIHLIPLGIEELPDEMKAFDTVFSMGVLYHRKSPFDFLKQLKSLLKNGGELILETMVIDGNENTVLVPKNRYAQMRNVWFIPSVAAMELWLFRAGFSNIKTIDVTKTTVEEQRRTEWMTNESLTASLNPGNLDITVEGYPAPKRAIIIAKA